MSCISLLLEPIIFLEVPGNLLKIRFLNECTQVCLASISKWRGGYERVYDMLTVMHEGFSK